MENNKQIIGIVWIILHCFLISVLTAIVRVVSEDMHVLEIVFFYNFFAFLLMIPVILTKKRYLKLKTKKLHLHVLRAFLGAISLAMYFYAFTVIPLTEARAMALTGPLVSSLFAVVFLKEKIGWHRTIALVIGFIGALVILRPGTASFSYVSLMVVAAIFMWATIDVIIKILGRSEAMSSQLFYLTGLMALFSLPVAIYFWTTPDSYIQWFWLFILGVIFLLNVVAVFSAITNADIIVIAPFDFTGMVFTIIIAYLVFGEVIDFWTSCGSIIIAASSFYIVRREAKLAKKIRAIAPQSEV